MRTVRTKLVGLSDFGVTSRKFRTLGKRVVFVTILQRGANVRQLLRYSPAERLRRDRERLGKGIELIESMWKGKKLKPRGSQSDSSTIDGRTTAMNALEIARLPIVSYVFVNKIAGIKRKRRSKTLRYFAVRGIVVVQIEEQTSGNQTIEDRIVLVKAFGYADACKRLEHEWKEYAKPYLNPYGYLVRWRLEKITNVYDLCEDHIDSRGTEVYSQLKSRRVQSKSAWRPRKVRHRRRP